MNSASNERVIPASKPSQETEYGRVKKSLQFSAPLILTAS